MNWSVALTIAVLGGVIGCADGTLHFGGGGTLSSNGAKITVSGDIADSRQTDSAGNTVAVPAGRDVAVFVYSNLRCCNASFVPATDLPFRSVDFTVAPFDTVELSDLAFDDVESVIVSGGSGSFTVGKVSEGDLTVFFLLDDAVGDGSIDAGDPVAVLTDDNGRLVDVRAGRSVTAQAIDITFDTDFPVGTADPDTIKTGTADGSAP